MIFGILQEDPHCQAALGCSLPMGAPAFPFLHAAGWCHVLPSPSKLLFLVLPLNVSGLALFSTRKGHSNRQTKIRNRFQTMGRWDGILGTGFSCSAMEKTVDIFKFCHFCNGYEGRNTQFYHFWIFAMMQLQIETCFMFSVLDYSVEKRWGWGFTGVITGLCSHLLQTLQVWEEYLLQIHRKPQLRNCMCHKQLHIVKLRETFAMCAPGPF